MGRTSKFTFPVPGRKQRHAPGPQQPPPMTKAQKVLGGGEINIDAPTQWESVSNSGISVTISDSTASFNQSERTAGNPKSRVARTQKWEEESDTVPEHLRATGAPRAGRTRKGSAGTGREHMDFSEVSSIDRRRQSSSTIASWYDKSRVPLSISQQTSSSAIAKGLPTKASTLLDIDGAASNANNKKGTKLDLPHFLSRNRAAANSSESNLRGHYVAPNSSSGAYLTPSAPQADSARPRLEKRRSTMERLHDFVERSTHHRQREPVMTPAAPSADDNANLHSLYEHYEQMSFRQVMDEELQEQKRTQHTVLSPVAESTGYSAPLSRESPPLKPAIREPRNKNQSQSQSQNQAQTQTQNNFFDPNKPISPNKPIMSADTDYAASVSSRHTRTSKASKRTNQSFFESDLQQTSVLSLSSDSEDDAIVDPSKGSSPIVRARQDSSEEEASVSRTQQRPPQTARSTGKSSKRASFASSNTYLTIPNESTPPRQPQHLTPRSSSLLHGKSPQSVSSPISSRLSVMSTSTTNSAMTWQSRSIYGLQEARTGTLRPPHAGEKAPDRSRDRQVAPAPSTRSARSTRSSLLSVNQPTPPLSPSSAEVCIHPPEHDVSTTTPNPRLMAVTKQEEMLLAALRMKRARMRESILNELDEEALQAEPRERSSAATLRQATYVAPIQALRNQDSRGSVRTVGRDRRPEYHDGPSSVTNLSTRARSPAASIAHTEPLDRQPRGQTSRLRDERHSGEDKHERILMYLDQPADANDAAEEEEPSPDLSDFMDLDNGSEDVSDDFTLPPSAVGQRHAAANPRSPRRSTRTPKTAGIARPDSPPLSPKSPIPSIEEDGVYVVGYEGVIDRASALQSGSHETALALDEKERQRGRKKALRLSAVGRVGMEAGLWGDDG